MIAEQKTSLIMFALICIGVFIYNLGQAFYFIYSRPPLPSFEFLFRGIFLCGVVWWLRGETKSSPVTRVYCAGLLLGGGWPIIIPYHLLKTRGLRGLLPLFALLAAMAVPRTLLVIVYVAIFGFPGA